MIESLYNNPAISYTLYSNTADNCSWTSDEISLYKNPHGEKAVLNTVNVVIGGGYGSYCDDCNDISASASTTYNIFLEDGTVIKTGSVSKDVGYTTSNARTTISFSMLDLDNINSNTYFKINAVGKESKSMCGHDNKWANTESGVISVECTYIALN